jgi:hypothetical protein
MDPKDPDETLWMHEQAGFFYDSSMTHDRYAGWRRGLSHPYFPFSRSRRRELRTVQMAVAWMDDHVFGRLQDNGGERLPLLRSLVDRAAAQGGCFTVNVHDYVFDDILFPEWRRTFETVWQLVIESGDFWIATPLEVAQHWVRRSAAVTARSTGLTEGRA